MTRFPRPAAHVQGPALQALDRRRRLRPGERERAIVEEAARLFAEAGFGATTRELARRLGVTQALIYRYFPTKRALIERVFEGAFGAMRERRREPLSADRSVPLEDRLIRFYRGYLKRDGGVSMRLFVRAGLEGAPLARRWSTPLTEKVLKPVIGELRAAAGLAGFELRPLMRGERELTMMLHGAVMFLRIRKHVYGMPMPDDLGDILALQVRTYVPGALAEIARLHATPGEDTLTVRQLDARGRA